MRTKKMQKNLSILMAALLSVNLLVMEPVAKVTRPSAKDIPVSTMIIGSYLVALSGLGDAVYDISQKSAEVYNQPLVYYKSELSGGQWYDITNAAGLDDVVSKGIPINNSVIDKLTLTHWLKDDYKLYDLQTGDVVMLLDSTDVWNPLSMRVELSTLIGLYQNGTSDEREVAAYLLGHLDARFANEGPPQYVPAPSSVVAEMIPDKVPEVKVPEGEEPAPQPPPSDYFVAEVDLAYYRNAQKGLEGFQAYLLSANGINDVMREQVDEMLNDLYVEMQITAYTQMQKRLDRFFKAMQSKKTTSMQDLQTTIPTLLTSKLAELDAKKSVATAPYNMLTTFISNERKALMENATAQDYLNATENLKRYYYLKAIFQEEVRNGDIELPLDREVIHAATEELGTLLLKGETDDYQAAVGRGEYEAKLSEIRTDAISVINDKEKHLEFLIDAEKLRSKSPVEMDRLLTERIQWCLDKLPSIREDSFKQGHLDVLKAYLTYLGHVQAVVAEEIKVPEDPGGTETITIIAEQMPRPLNPAYPKEPVTYPNGVPAVGKQDEPLYVAVLPVTQPDGTIKTTPAEPSGKTDSTGNPLYVPTPSGKPLKDDNGDPIRDKQDGLIESKSNVPNSGKVFDDLKKKELDAEKKLNQAIDEKNPGKALEALGELQTLIPQINAITPSVDPVTLAANENLDNLADECEKILTSPLGVSELARLGNNLDTMATLAEIMPQKAPTLAADISEQIKSVIADNPLLESTLTSALGTADNISNGTSASTVPSEEFNFAFAPASLAELMERVDSLLPDSREKTVIKGLVLCMAADTDLYSDVEVRTASDDLTAFAQQKPVFGSVMQPAWLDAGGGIYMLPMDVLGETASWRYFWDSKTNKSILSKGTHFNTYQYGAPVYHVDEVETILDMQILYKLDVGYVSEAHSNKVYGVYKQFLPLSYHAVLHTEGQQKQAESLFKQTMGVEE